MGWLHRNKQGTTALDDRFATSAEIEGVFDAEREDLGWIAYAISGNKQPAEESLADPKKLQPIGTGVFATGSFIGQSLRRPVSRRPAELEAGMEIGFPCLVKLSPRSANCLVHRRRAFRRIRQESQLLHAHVQRGAYSRPR
jgi:hypothetical protein